MAFAAVVGVGLSAVGVWLVKRTFDETRKGAQAAADSYNAFIKFEDAGINVDTFKPVVREQNEHRYVSANIVFSNIGRSPAIINDIVFGDEKFVHERILVKGESYQTQYRIDCILDDNDIAKGVICYITVMNEEIKRVFFVAAEPGHGVIAYPGYILKKGDEEYDVPLRKT